MSEAPNALARWCGARGLTPKDLARLVGCSEQAARAWVREGRRPLPEYRCALHRVTGLDEFRPSPSDELAAMGSSERERYAAASAEVALHLTRLRRALQPFVSGPVGARECLRRTVDPSLVAQAAGLAQLVFDEERFADWLLLQGALDEEGARREPRDGREDRTGHRKPG